MMATKRKKKVEKVVEFTPEPPKIHPKIGKPAEVESNMRRQIRRGNVDG
jgi:hypothetical protein